MHAPVNSVARVKGDYGHKDVHDVSEEAAMVHGAAGLLAEVGVGRDQQGEGAGQLGLEVHHPGGLRLVLGAGLGLLPQQQLVQEDPGRGRGVANLKNTKTL